MADTSEGVDLDDEHRYVELFPPVQGNDRLHSLSRAVLGENLREALRRWRKA